MLPKIAFLSSFFAVALAQGSMNCYPLGAAGAGPFCSRFIDTFCNAVTKDQLQAGESSGRCYNFSMGGNKCDFMAFNSMSANGPPSLDDCKSILNNVATQCQFGGFGRPSDTGYTYIVDPNSGHCG